MSEPPRDRFRRLELLGEGGSGRVWLVEDRHRPAGRVALKEPADDAEPSPEPLLREFATLARFRHPGLAEALDIETVDGPTRFTLEYVEGEDLVAAVAREGPALLPEMAAEALRVLAFLHDFGLVHRDLKPANVLVRRRPRLGSRLVLLDLGLAVVGDAAEGDPSRGPAGTLQYLAPEIFDNAQPSPRTDLYALGAVVYEAAYGQPPYALDQRDLATFLECVREGRRARPPLPAGFPEGLAAWVDQLLAPDPAARPAEAREALARLNAACGTSFPAETAVSRAARLASDPPCGRDAELGEIWSALDPAAGPRLVWLTGPVGSGKSRMLRWIHTEAVVRGWHALAPRTALQSPAATFLRDLRAGASERPTLLLLDEVEAADGALIKILDRIAREGHAPPVQVVAAARPGEATHGSLQRLLRDAATVPTMRRVRLEPLGRDGLRALAERATGTGAISEARLRWLVDASEGSPLLAESVLVEGIWEKGGRRQRSATLEQSVTSRIRLLSEPGARWLEALAVLGRDASGTDIEALSGLRGDETIDAAEEVRLAGLARLDREHWSPESRSVPRVALERIEESRRATLHRAAAEMQPALGEADCNPWRLARLWSAAGDSARAAACAIEAAHQSSEANDPDEAAERLAFALRHFRRRDPGRLALRVDQAEALLSAGRYAAAARAYGAALRLARKPAQRADLLGRQAHALVWAGRFDRARAAADEAVSLADAHGLDLARARARKAVGMLLGRLGQESEALALFEQALPVFRREGDVATEAEALQNLAACKSRLGRADAEQDFLRAIELDRTLGKSGSELKSLLGLAVVHHDAGRVARSRDLLEQVRARAADHGHLDLLENASSKLAMLAIDQGELDQGLSLSQEALDQSRHLGNPNRLTVNRCRLAEAMIGCGRPVEAMELLREALQEPAEEIEPDMLDATRLLLVHAMLESPALAEDDARILLERCLEGFRRRRKTRPLMLALVTEMERRARSALSEPVEPVRMELDALAETVEIEAEIRIRADLARAADQLRRGDPAGARDAAGAAVEAADDAELLEYGARARGLLGEALEQVGAVDEARQAFAAGAELLDRAAARLADPEVRRSFVDRAIFRSLRDRRAGPPGNDQERLLALYGMIRALNTETDPEALLETILDMALRAATAERGMILLRDPSAPDRFSVRAARNLDVETERDAEDFSRSIVAQAGEGRSILSLDAGHDERFRDLKSVSLFGIRSLMCVPLRSLGEVVGTVYLDCRRSGALFTPEDLRFVEAFADHAALALHNARERAALVEENRALQTAAETRVRFGNIVGRSTAMQKVFDLIEKVADSDLPVLVQGESGTGKELVARAVHFNGPLRRKIFLTENCAAIPETLLETELFGHVKGAFTGAERDRRGLFEQADGGTLFLDEVGDMSPGMQARLLRVLQNGEIRRVGDDAPIQVKVRLIAASHRNLSEEAEAGRFREDLYYRLQVVPIHLPALRDRPEDIPPLVEHLLERIARERGRPTPPIEPGVRDVLERYSWPGNVRQLENTLQRLVLLAGAGAVTTSLLESDESFRTTLLGRPGGMAAFSFRDAAADQLRRALTAAGGNRERAARLLGVSRATIYRKIKDLGLQDLG